MLGSMVVRKYRNVQVHLDAVHNTGGFNLVLGPAIVVPHYPVTTLDLAEGVLSFQVDPAYVHSTGLQVLNPDVSPNEFVIRVSVQSYFHFASLIETENIQV